jgi:hypothetical protein
VVIHVSSHGAQVEDDNYDEPDGLDESIVTYPAVIPSKSTNYSKDQEAYFRDDKFGYYINLIRKKLGTNGDVLVFMDFCHAGTGTRGSGTARGGETPLVSSTYKQKSFSQNDNAWTFTETPASTADSSLATYMAFSGSKEKQLSFQTEDDNGEPIGSLTYAVTKSFENLSEGTTYRGFFSKIQSIMKFKSGNQTPVVEGNALERTLLGGHFVDQKPFIEIDDITGKHIVLKSGRFFGLDSGARVGIYPSGTIDPATTPPLVMGTVVAATSFQSSVLVDTHPGLEDPTRLWAFLLEPVYELNPIGIKVDETFPDSRIDQVKETLKNLPLIRFSGQPELIILPGEKNDSLIIALSGYLFDTLKLSGDYSNSLRMTLLRYCQYKFLQELEIKDPTLKIEIDFVPILKGVPDLKNTDTYIKNGRVVLNEGDSFAIRIVNKSSRAVYVNAVDIQPDGIINAVLPRKSNNILPSGLRIPAGASGVYKPFVIAKPYGTEILKIFVSRTEIDMEGIANTRGRISRGNFSFLEQLFQDSYQIGTRGLATNHLKNTNGSVFNFIFDITPKE